jgi:hypothetical protein
MLALLYFEEMRQLNSSSSVFALIAALALVAIAAVALSSAPRRSGFASPAAIALASTKPTYDEYGAGTTFSQFKTSAPAGAPNDAAIHADLLALHKNNRNDFTADGIDQKVLNQ